MFLRNTIQQWLKLCCIPGRVEQYNTLICNQVQAIGRQLNVFVQVVCGIKVEIACKRRNL